MKKEIASARRNSLGKTCRTILCVCLFILTFLIAFRYVSERLRLKTGSYNTINGFYQEPENTLDIIFVGTSHIYRAVSPMYLWERFGIPSYNVGTPAQAIVSSYYVLRQVLQRQHPKAVMLDVYGAQYEGVIQKISRVRPVTDGMRWDRSKIDMFLEYLIKNYSPESVKELAFPFLTYHTRWEDLEWKDFQEGRSSTKGFAITFASRPKEQPPEYEAKDIVPALYLEYLDKIIALCREKEVDLILCQIPMGDWEGYRQQREKMRYFMDYAQAQGVRILDFSRMTDEIGLDYSTDFRDSDHLNTSGAYKMTEFVGAYLKEQYQLPDHRGEKSYEQWDVLLADYWAKYSQKKNGGQEDDEEDSIE